VTAREPDGQPTEVDEEAGEEVDEPSGRGPIVVLSVIAMVGVWRTVVAFPEVAYVVVGSLGTVGVQKARARWGKQGGDSEEGQEEVAKPDVVEALRRLIGDDKGVLLTRLQKDLGLPNTKAVKALLEAEDIPWKASRTREGNGPAVRKEAIPPAPSPAVADPYGGGCCCRSGDNNNGNNAAGEGAGEGIRVEAIGDGGQILRGSPVQRSEAEEIFGRFLAEAFKGLSSKGEVNDG